MCRAKESYSVLRKGKIENAEKHMLSEKRTLYKEKQTVKFRDFAESRKSVRKAHAKAPSDEGAVIKRSADD